MKHVIGIILIVIGLNCLVFSGYLVWQRVNPNRLAFKTSGQPLQSKQIAGPKPIRLQVQKYQIDVPVLPSQIIGTTWETTDEGVSFLTSTVSPGDKGNSVMYGHNFANILGKLTLVKPGDKISVTMNDRSERQFVVRNTQEVTPDQTHILNQTEKPVLTLYTCSGLFDSKRFVAVATPL